MCQSLLFLDGQHFVPRAGVPQGSVASALLCCLHYGGLDLAHLARFLPRWLQAAGQAAG